MEEPLQKRSAERFLAYSSSKSVFRYQIIICYTGLFQPLTHKKTYSRVFTASNIKYTTGSSKNIALCKLLYKSNTYREAFSGLFKDEFNLALNCSATEAYTCCTLSEKKSWSRHLNTLHSPSNVTKNMLPSLYL